MPILLLVRHGTNDFVKTGRLPGQAPNLHLNDEGRLQAQSMARMLEKHTITAVYSSQLERAIETAWYLAAPRGLPILIRPALADTHTGDYTARTTKELSESPETRDIWKTIVEKPSEGRLPNGESLVEMQQRVIAELERIIAAFPDPEPPKTDPVEPAVPNAKGEEKPAAGSNDSSSASAPAAPEKPPAPPPPAIVAIVMHADPIKAAIAHFLGMPFDNFQRLGTSPASVSTVMVMGKHIAVMNLNQVADK